VSTRRSTASPEKAGAHASAAHTLVDHNESVIFYFLLQPGGMQSKHVPALHMPAGVAVMCLPVLL
jgi:hypothetical protein